LKENESHSDPIDAVIAWVDGNDPVHRQKRLKALNRDAILSDNPLPTGKDKTRFVDNGELKYCIASIRKFAPWIRNIYLVTDNQTPDFLTEALMNTYGVQIIDHRDIFKGFEWALPTFNTRTIETGLWRIPGLASKFIYFNDDFIITSPVKPTDFFNKNGVVLRGKWKKMTNYGPFRMKVNNAFSFIVKHLLGITRSMHLLLQIRSAQLAGLTKRYYYTPHVPHPVRRDTLAGFFDEHPDQFKKNIKYPFRDTDQFSAIFLANHLEITKQSAELRTPDSAVMINGEMDLTRSINKKIERIRQNEVQFLCIQGLEILRPKTKRHLTNTLSADLGIKME
jgi:hypothetical protein